MSDTESIHFACWTKDETYESILINERSEVKYSQILTYNVVLKKLTYEEIDLKGEIVNIYQKPQALINYLIDIFSKEGYWVLDLFSRSCNIFYITYETSVIILYLYYIFFKFMFHYAIFFSCVLHTFLVIIV